MEGDQADLDAVQAEHLVKGGKMARYLPEKYKKQGVSNPSFIPRGLHLIPSLNKTIEDGGITVDF